MRLVLDHGRCCPSELRAGEGKRVPRSPLTALVGYYVGCPYCARPQVLVARRIDPEGGQDFVEGNDGVTMGPGHTCNRCGVRFLLARGEFVRAA